MAIDLIIKEGDTRDWSFVISDSSNDELNLTSARVQFRLKRHEWHGTNYFERDTDGTGSDYISISTPASDGTVTITPTSADYADLSDTFGVFVGEFKVTDSNDDDMATKDIHVRIDEAVI